MGRIAEALKKAQQERARHLESATGVEGIGPSRSDAPPSADRLMGSGKEAGTRARDIPIRKPTQPRSLQIKTSPILPESIDARVVAYHGSTLPIAEKYRSVRTRLLTSNPNGSPRALAITSSVPKEGKTVTTANLAFSLAELNHLWVVMLDLDFRRRGLSRLLQVQDEPGIAEVLRGEKKLTDVCLSVVKRNLYLIPAGNPGKANPSELLGGARAANLFKELNERFHYSLIDTPPVNTTADIGLIGPLCHSALIVVRINQTPEPSTHKCVQTLQANNIAITGCIMTGCYDDTATYSEIREYCTNGK